MRCSALVAIVMAATLGCGGACSGEDARRRPTTPADSSGGAATSPTADDAPAAATAEAPPAAGAAAPVAELTEDMGRPFFADGAGKAAAERFALEDWAGAAAGFAKVKAALPAADTAGRARAALLGALAEARLGRWSDAARGFAEARAGLPHLADWIGYQEARARFFAHDAGAALTLARAVASDSIAGADAELLVGDLLRGKGDPAAVAAHYRDYLTRRPEGIRRSEARFRLAEAIEQQGAAADLGEAVAAYRAITLDDPLSSWTTKAKARLAAIAKGAGPAATAAAAPLTAAELITRGKVYFDAMRNPESEADFAAALATPGLTPAEACVAAYHRAQSLFKARDRKAAAPRFDEAAAACKTAGDKDLEIRSDYQAGRAYAFIGDKTAAIARYQAAQKVDPAHSFTDDALLREAEEWADLGDGKKVTETLERLPVAFPAGDMRAEAMWRLGWRAYRDGDDARAIAYWQKQIALVPIDDNYWAEGQAQYWIGRAEARRGKRDAALASWESAVRTYPVSYYAMLALNRVRETAPARYAALVKELTADPPGFDPAAPAFHFKPRPEYATPGFGRAVELIRLGLGDEAEAELRKLKLVAPGDKKRVDDPDRIEKLWAMAWLYDRAGRHGTAHWPTRWHILDYKRQWAVGANRARWQIAYPRAYYELLETHAEKNGVVVEMLQAIVREESAFDPLRESYANAIGLTQMIFPTAKRFAKGTGIDATRENLRDPEKNVTIGTRFLGYLFTHWKGFKHLVPPSYNAGEGAVKRMLKVRGTWPADEFIEGIVDDQARNYSKRVLGSFFAYSWIYGGVVPEMPNQIPPALLPTP
ncbi:MAG TPA: transglycosylase SLT domain-containing protein [Kofleriaceae bacterium]|nr:transglycosylase SLT domain-containing protein [Kofleriaceae bacterium]